MRVLAPGVAALAIGFLTAAFLGAGLAAQPGRKPPPPEAPLGLWIETIEKDPQLHGNSALTGSILSEFDAKDLEAKFGNDINGFRDLIAEQARTVLWSRGPDGFPEPLASEVLAWFREHSDDAPLPGTAGIVWPRVRGDFRRVARALIARRVYLRGEAPTNETGRDESPADESKAVAPLSLDSRLPAYLPVDRDEIGDLRAAPDGPSEGSLIVKLVCDEFGEKVLRTSDDLINDRRESSYRLHGHQIHWEIEDARIESAETLRLVLRYAHEASQRADGERTVFLDVLEGATFGDVAETIDEVRAAGFRRIDFGGRRAAAEPGLRVLDTNQTIRSVPHGDRPVLILAQGQQIMVWKNTARPGRNRRIPPAASFF